MQSRFQARLTSTFAANLIMWLGPSLFQQGFVFVLVFALTSVFMRRCSLSQKHSETNVDASFHAYMNAHRFSTPSVRVFPIKSE